MSPSPSPDASTGCGSSSARRSAYVTGGTRGIGFAIAGKLARDGYRVSVCGASAEGLHSCRLACEASGLDLRAERVDVCDEAAIGSAITAAAERDGRLDLLVCCAGRPVLGAATELSTADWDRCLDLNLRSVFVCVKAALVPMCRQGGGAIVLVSSIWARTTTTERPAYTAAKTALSGLARALAVDHAASGVRVNVVAPGYVDTRLLRDSLGRVSDDVEGELRRVARAHPLGRLVAPEDVAGAVAFLGGEAARSITGQTLYVDGGVSVRFALPEG